MDWWVRERRKIDLDGIIWRNDMVEDSETIISKRLTWASTENCPVCCSGGKRTWITCMLFTGSFVPPKEPYPLMARIYNRTRELVVATKYILPDSAACIGVMSTIVEVLGSNNGEFADKIWICDNTDEKE